jgi:hypothetical protein
MNLTATRPRATQILGDACLPALACNRIDWQGKTHFVSMAATPSGVLV